jgi:hypothetical protein
MKLVSAERGRFVVLFPTEEIRPIGGIVLATFVSAVSERYQFLHPPSLADIGRSSNWIFREGGFLHDKDHLEIGEFGIFSEGISVEARTTEIAELFMQDFLGWARERFQLRELAKQPRIYYNSHLVVDADSDLNALVKQFDIINGVLKSALSECYAGDISMQTTRVWFGQDQREVPQGAIVLDFGIERRANVPFGAKRLFSSAPLPTSKHLQLLQRLEDALSSA